MADNQSPPPPASDDVRQDDLEFNPALEPKSSRAWLNLLKESEKAFKDWNDHCDLIDKRFASLQRLADQVRDKEFQMFWANMEVVKPAIYARPPIPVVVTKFKDRRPVPQAASEVAERCAIVAFDLTRINELMLLVRDDLALACRGVAWCRYESAKGKRSERVTVDFKNRRDFLHTLARNWREVTWVAGASYLTRSEARDRFHPASGDEYQSAEYRVDKDNEEVGGADKRERAIFWEIWDKTNQRVVWVSEGCENILDEDDPHLELLNFFPCPRPAYGTVQRGSLVPVPDVLQYKDQLEEIDTLTGRIHALSEAIEVKGFYPAGGSELADAVQAAIATKAPGRVLVPISNWAAFGGTKDVIIWLPIDMIAETITGLVALRKQVIDDVYQLTGLADIMRGDTDPDETLGAQQLKTQYGTTRIRDKQQELVRLARDVVEITVEIIAEKFKAATIIDMSQTQLPTNAMVEGQARQIQQQLEQMGQHMQMLQQQAQLAPPQPSGPPQPPAPGGAPPPPGGSPPPPGGPPGPPPPDPAAQMQQQMMQGMELLNQLARQPTIEQVLHFLKDNSARAFVLDIETDSTVLADENAEKQRRTEFVGVLSQLLPQLAQMIAADPSTAEFCGEVLKFATAPFRAGRSLDSAIDDLVEKMKQKGQQPQNDPMDSQNKTAIQIEQMKINQQQSSDSQRLQLEQMKLAQQDRHKQQDLQLQSQLAMQDSASDASSDQAKVMVQNQKMQESSEAHQAEMAAKQQEMMINAQKANQALQVHQLKSQAMRQQAIMPQIRPQNMRLQ